MSLSRRRSSLRNPLLAFAIVTLLLSVGAMIFIQSSLFAHITKQWMVKLLPPDLGVKGEFADFSIRFFPPGISVNEPQITLEAKNILGLPGGSEINARRIDLLFRPFQMLSGNIRINEVVAEGGRVHLVLPKPAEGKTAPAEKKKTPLSLKWEDLLSVRGDQVTLLNTEVVLYRDGKPMVSFYSERATVAKETLEQRAGYRIEAELRTLKIDEEIAPQGFAVVQKARASARVDSTGAQLDQLQITTPGLDLEAKGEVRGDLLRAQGLQASLQVTLATQLDRLLAELLPDSKLAAQGRAQFIGQLECPLDQVERFAKNLRATGRLEIADAKIGDWSFHRMSAEGRWDRGGVEVESAVVEAPETPRLGHQQPGSGGKIHIGKFSIPVASALRELTISPEIELTRAHIHWLAAPALAKVYPLDFRISGKIRPQVTLTRLGTDKTGFSAKAQADLVVDDFRLDNQKLGRPKPMHAVLKIPRIAIQTDVQANDRRILLENLKLAVNKTAFAGGGTIDFKQGLDLVAEGDVDLAEIDTIAENTIRGTGRLKAHVHGPGSAIVADFDTELVDSAYLNMNLGRTKGRISWVDDKDHLVFDHVAVTQGATVSDVYGHIDLGVSQSINISVDTPKGLVQDYVRIFADFAKDLSWFPRTINGPMSGRGTITGGLGLDAMVIGARIQGANWEYFGERFRDVTLDGGIEKRKYALKSFRVVKDVGRILGKISFEERTRHLDWDVRTEGLNLRDFDHVARMNVPLRATIEASSLGSGREGAVKSSTLIAVSRMSTRGREYAPSELAVTSESGVIKVRGSLFQGLGSLAYDHDARSGGTLKLTATQIDFSPTILILNPSLATDPELEGVLSGTLEYRFATDNPDLGSGQMHLSEYRLAKKGSRFALAEPVRATIQQGTFGPVAAELRGDSGSVKLSLSAKAAQLRGTIKGALDLAIAEFFTPLISRTMGSAQLDFAVGGRLLRPTLFGRASVPSASFWVAALETPVENLRGNVSLRDGKLTLQGFESDLAGGHTFSDGTIEFFPDRYPALNLRTRLQSARLKIYPFQYLKLSGSVDLTGTERPYLASGSVAIESGFSREKVFSQRGGQGLRSAQYTPSHSTSSDLEAPFLRLDITAKADGKLYFQNELIDGEAKADVRVIGTVETPRIVGTAEIVQGRIFFKDHQFQIQSASANFDNPTALNPQLLVLSSADVAGTKVSLYVSGRMLAPKIELSSNPALSESEILSLLALGITSTDTRRMSANERSRFEQGEAASLILNSLDFNREVQNQTGFSVQLDEAVNSQQGQSAFRAQSQTDSGTAPKIVIRRQVGKNLELSGASTVGVGSTSQKEVNATVKVNNALSVIGVWQSYETQDTQTQQNRDSFGLDLKVQRRFK